MAQRCSLWDVYRGSICHMSNVWHCWISDISNGLKHKPGDPRGEEGWRLLNGRGILIWFLLGRNWHYFRLNLWIWILRYFDFLNLFFLFSQKFTFNLFYFMLVLNIFHKIFLCFQMRFHMRLLFKEVLGITPIMRPLRVQPHLQLIKDLTRYRKYSIFNILIRNFHHSGWFYYSVWTFHFWHFALVNIIGTLPPAKVRFHHSELFEPGHTDELAPSKPMLLFRNQPFVKFIINRDGFLNL